MNNPNIGIMLRHYRKAAELSVQQVAEKLKNDYNMKVSTKTIYSWENSQNQPSADTLLTLCKIYNITNMIESLGYEGPAEQAPLILSPEERKVIAKYRSSRYFNAVVQRMLDIED